MASRTPEQRVSFPMLRASWDAVTFVHWPLPPDQVQALLPEGLTVDVCDGAAWVGLVPFVMANMRPLGWPNPTGGRTGLHGLKRSLARLTSTPETNLRTYVRGPDGRDGLWFLTLDIGSTALAAALRAGVGAPYHRAHLTVEGLGDRVTYTGRRVGGRPAYSLQVRPGKLPDTSDFGVWLTGRWRAYTHHLGRLLVTPVEHEPWPLCRAHMDIIEQDVTEAGGLSSVPETPVVHFSEGVRSVRLGRPTVLSGL